MSDEQDLSGVEDILRRVGPPSEVPDRYRAAAAAAALGDDAVEAGATRARRASWWRRPQWVAAAGALACVVVVAVALAVHSGSSGGGGGGGWSGSTIALQGVSPGFSNASGTLKLGGGSSGAMRNAVFTVQNLPPAPKGSYYEMWMESGNESVGIMAFDTEANGSMTVRSAIPANMPWTRCWVSLEHETGSTTTTQSVLRST